MQKLRGSGSTFSTSGKRWNPFRFDRTIAAQNAKRHRLVRAGIAMTKAELQAEAQRAAQSHVIHRIPAGKRTTSRTND
jgi:hypothetical protein